MRISDWSSDVCSSDLLDNLYLSNNGRHVISDQVNLDDMMTSRPGGIVRLKTGAMPSQGHVMPLEPPLVAAAAFPENGRAPGRDRECAAVQTPAVADALKKQEYEDNAPRREQQA